MLLRFRYRNAEGIESERTLTQWSENTRYIQGRSPDDSLPKTYLKARIFEYLEGEDHLLGDAAPPAPEPTPKAQPDQRAQIQFTGFPKAKKFELEELATIHGLRVMASTGKNLAFLCCGPNAGPAKIARAHEAGAIILGALALRHLLDTGEMLDTD